MGRKETDGSKNIPLETSLSSNEVDASVNVTQQFERWCEDSLACVRSSSFSSWREFS
jgi:hypothetical protein